MKFRLEIPLDRKKALIVDDDKSILRILTRIFQKQGFDAETAETRKETEEKMNNTVYDVGIIDVKLPDMDGTDLLARMPTNAANTIKIIITGHPSEEVSQKALTGGADAYLIKPVKPEQLIQTIKQKLTKQEQTISAQNVSETIANSNLHILPQRDPDL